ncbi:MAG: response regulator transcription factor [Edaphobacter sp.]
MTILLVDDNAGVRRLVRRAISYLAADIRECEDGSEALETYAQSRPDIVLMDIRMPQMDGLAATKEIRKVYPAARILMLTDYDDEELRAASREAGACGYVLKQNLTGLAALVQHFVETSRAPLQ